MSLLTHVEISASLLGSVKKTLEESNEYQKKVQAHMAKKGIKSLNDLTDDQKKKFFNELDAMHKAKNEEVEAVTEGSTSKEKQKTPYRDITSPEYKAAVDKQKENMKQDAAAGPGKKLLDKIKSKAKNEEVEAVEEGTGVTDYAPKSQGGTRKELIAKYHKSKNPKDAEAARKAGATQKELQGEEVEAVEESFSDAQISQLRGEMSKISGIDPASPTYKKLVDMLNNMGMKELTKLADANIKFISGLARNRVIRAGMKKEEVELEEDEGVMEGSKHASRPRSASRPGTEPAKKGSLQDRIMAARQRMDAKKKANEEVELDEEQLNELDKSTLASYIKKRSNDVATMGAMTRKHAMDSETAKKDQNYMQARKSDEMSNKAFAKGWKHRQNIAKAVDKLTKEELEFIESLNAKESSDE